MHQRQTRQRFCFSADPTVPVRVSAAELNRTNWILVEANDNEPVLADPEVTLMFEAEQFSGFAGYNNYGGSFALGDDNASVLEPGAIISTQMMCGQLVSDQESTYLSARDNAAQ